MLVYALRMVIFLREGTSQERNRRNTFQSDTGASGFVDSHLISAHIFLDCLSQVLFFEQYRQYTLIMVCLEMGQCAKPNDKPSLSILSNGCISRPKLVV